MNGLEVTGVLPLAMAASDTERIAALFDGHHDRLYRLARRLVPSADEALDLVQETFLNAARAVRSIPSGFTQEEAWLVRVLINIRRNQWRKASVRQRYDEHTRRCPVDARNEEAALVAHAAVWAALDTLTPRRRAVIVMHELEGMNVKDIASMLRISAITVRWHLSRGRRDLARILKPQIGERA
jgi:RNA polymerase sigma-70 factor (ECF subfamily)